MTDTPETNLPANTTKATSPALPSDIRPYSRVARAAQSDVKFLKFIKGQYLTGSGDDECEVPLRTRIVVYMGELQCGHLRWWAGEKTGEVMVRIADGATPPTRNDLDDFDSATWEKDVNGAPRDPWAETWAVPVYDPAADAQYTFTTGSKGGMSALGELAAIFDDECDDRAGHHLLVELGADTYKHRQYGRVHVPAFKFLGWVDDNGDPTDKPAKPAGTDIDDDIPF